MLTRLTWTMLPMSMGSIERGNRRMLNSDRETNAFSASSIFFGDDKTYTANVVSDTCLDKNDIISSQSEHLC